MAVKDVAAGAQGSFKNSGWSEIASGTDYFDISGDYTLVISPVFTLAAPLSGVVDTNTGVSTAGIS